jgi:hypothetical protein
VPSLDLLLKGVDDIYHLLSSRNESHEHIAAKAKDWITFLYEAVDVAGLVESLPVPKEGEDHALRVLTSAVNRAAHKIGESIDHSALPLFLSSPSLLLSFAPSLLLSFSLVKDRADKPQCSVSMRTAGRSGTSRGSIS